MNRRRKTSNKLNVRIKDAVAVTEEDQAMATADALIARNVTVLTTRDPNVPILDVTVGIAATSARSRSSQLTWLRDSRTKKKPRMMRISQANNRSVLLATVVDDAVVVGVAVVVVRINQQTHLISSRMLTRV